MDGNVWVRTDDQPALLPRFIDRYVDGAHPGDPRFEAFGCAVAAFTLAVVALLGQNVVTIGVGTVSEGIFDGREGFYVGWGLAIVSQVGVVLLLARRTFAATGRWEATLGRAGVLVSGLTLVAAVLIIIGGGILYDPSSM